MNIPSELRAGDSLAWIDTSMKDNLGNLVDASWVLTYVIAGGVSPLSLTGSTYGTGWKTSITKSQSDALGAGIRYWQAFAEKASDRITLGSGQIQILPNVSTAGALYDGRSQAERDLAAVQAAIRAIATGGGVAEYTIGNRSLRRIAIPELIELEDKLKREVNREKRMNAIRDGKPDPGKIKVRFR